MPERNIKYYAMGRGARKIHYMVVLIPASGDAYDDPTWEQFADGAIALKDAGELAYANDFPAGYPEKGAWKLNVNYRFLTSTQRDIISHYEHGTGAMHPYGDTFTLANVWRIYSDRGLSNGTDPDSAYWLKIYEGRQWLDPSPEAEILIGRGATITYELRDLVTETMRLVKMNLISLWLYTLVGVGLSDWGTDNIYTLPTDLQWHAGGHDYTVYQEVHEIDLLFYTYSKLMLTAQMLCDSVYRAHVRLDGNWESGYCWLWRSVNATEDHGVDPATPWDFIGNFEQDKTTAGDPGDPVDRTNRGFIGVYLEQGTSNPIGGLLQPGDEKGSLLSFGNLLEFMKEFVSLGICRATIDQAAAPDTVEVWFTPATLTGGPRSPIDLTLDDILVDDPEATVKPQLASNTILAQEWGARDPRGDDQQQWRDGSGDEKKYGGRLLWDTNPLTDVAGAWLPPAGWGGGVNHYSVANFMVWKTYYMAVPLGASTPGPIRVHHQVSYPKGFGSETLYGANSALPSLSTPSGLTDLVTHQANIEAIRSVAIANQAQGGIQAALIGAFRTFNDPAQTTIPLKLQYPIASATDFDGGHLGSEMTLPVDGASNHTVNALLESGADYLDGHTSSVLVNAKPNLDESILEVKIFGRED